MYAMLILLVAAMILISRQGLWTCIGAALAAYLLLSANSSLVQILAGGRYELYAISNFGSLLGLLVYPFFMESRFPTSANWIVLAVGLTVYAFSFLILAVTREAKPVESRVEADDNRAGYSPIKYFSLSFASCYLLNSVSTYLCLDVSPMPMLWTLILALYLLSYIVGFNKKLSNYSSLTGLLLVPIVLSWMTLSAQVAQAARFFLGMSAGLSLVLFGGFVIHSRLYRIRPSPNRLTAFYLMIAIGGAAGGTVASLLMPYVSNAAIEFPISIGIVFFVLWLELRSGSYDSLIQSFGTGKWMSARKKLSVLLPCLLVAVAGGGFLCIYRTEGKVLCRYRNLYGLGVVSLRAEKMKFNATHHDLYSGSTLHGLQLISGSRLISAPTLYYTQDSGGKAIERHPKHVAGKPMRIAVCGMGVGTLSSYAREGDAIRFYEVNPGVVDIATNSAYFTFLSKADGEVDIVVDDARRALEKERAGAEARYDVVVVDVFSGDSIPAHLATEEAFALYLDRLEPDGILAFHLTNWHLDLVPMVKAAARRFNLQIEVYECQQNGVAVYSCWAFMSRGTLPDLADNSTSWRVDLEKVRDIPLMTDDLHSLIPYIKW